jgi:hypothetical protein
VGSMKTDYIKAKEQRKNLERYRFRRMHAERATSKQIDYLVNLGHIKFWEAPATLDWVKDTFILPNAHKDITCFMDLNKEEVSKAITRLKEELTSE